MPISVDDVYSEWTNEVQKILRTPGYSTDKRVEELDRLSNILLSQKALFKAFAEIYASMADTTKKLADEMSNAYDVGVVL